MKVYTIFLYKIFLIKSVLILLLSLSLDLKSQRVLTVGGTNWTVTIPPISEAGSNYTGTYESATNQVLLGASVPLLLGNGKVSVQYQANPTWNSNLVLSARRTGNGTTPCAGCSITGGTSYITIPLATDVELFRITAVLALASYSNIPVQLQLSGVSVAIPAATYSSLVVFTIAAP
ncbi:hypothetical protein ODZ84_12290 [Chryseobacterium fluminis]|uniref:hypothetical protein n=1 Tax=Chryseobacterium fluminis TaxID=2983606 RepID=UPI002250EFA5|nr:hypothetical protein [Chryseobacterium sp. MMS21-Ot14]UZT96020.1 hypothetical protein ODZ84_12290 [Chryseobacterium sp. MMS21-Ot14]